MSEETCSAREDDGGDTDHCLHETGTVDAGYADLICCWCGFLFIGDEVHDEHGPHAPTKEG